MANTDGDHDARTWEAARPPIPVGAVRRLGQGLLQHKLFGAPRPRLGRFEVVRKVGEGGMGAVFEGLDPQLDRRVALKVLTEPGRALIDLRHEARMLARLSHPHVVAAYELGDEDGEAYVCMAFVDGPHLGTWLAARRPAPWQTVVQVLAGAARGLAAAHRAGLVHRDFKLENVLVGPDGVPQVTDFGLARVGPAPGALIRAEAGRASKLAGTPGYLAPEVVAGRPADARSDQYSLFVALRNGLALVGATPPPALAALIARGTADDPDQRLPDLDAVVDALDALTARRVLPDQRARDVLLARVRQLWVAPVRGAALREVGVELPLPCEVSGEAVVGGGSPAEVAAALHGARAGVMLVGAPGAGKTLRLLAIAEALMALDVDDATLPVVLNLSSFPGADLGAWLLHELVSKYALPRAQAERWLDAGQLALLLDGLDEVDPARRAAVVAALDALRAARPVAWVMTCREAEYDRLAPPPRADAVVRLRPLSPADRDAALATDAAADPDLAEALCNPLLLAMYRTVAGAPGDAGTLRDRLYARAVDAALTQPPALRPADADQTLAGLRWLAAATRRAGVTDVWLEELQAAWLPRPWQRAAAVALGVSFAFALSFAANLTAARVAGLPPASGWFFGFVAAAAAFVIQGGVTVVPMEAMAWSWRRVWTWIPRNLALGVAMGAAHGVFYDLWADLLLGVATGLLGLSVIGLVPRGRERRVNPGDGLVESLRNAVLVAPVIGLVIGAPVGYLVLPFAKLLADPTSMYHTHPNPELAWAVTMGTSAAVTSLLITGMLAPLLHLGVRVVLALTAPLPLRLAPWLDDLARRGLVHRIGGGWLFRHPTLRDWLAEPPP